MTLLPVGQTPPDQPAGERSLLLDLLPLFDGDDVVVPKLGDGGVGVRRRREQDERLVVLMVLAMEMSML